MDTFSAPRMEPAADSDPAEWLVNGLAHAEHTVRSLLPAGYAAYARILHPAESPDGEPVRWADVARWSARVLHPLARFDALAHPVPATETGPPPFDDPPWPGSLTADDLGALLPVLAAHTDTAGDCWFCVWDGWGWLASPETQTTLRAGRGTRADDAATVTPPGVRLPPNAPRVHLPARGYLLFHGPLRAAADLGDRGEDYFFPQSPNLFWPDDRAWCVATDVDLTSTYVAGSRELVGAILATDTLEALPARPDDPAGEHGDPVN
ncbi:hypothetical protein [Actinomadura atramentaria]|uniref:hypothetical protein n=1 Tax=Actinomadura atramentaria TaxID=1990 RepID=UPI0003791F88|nr:hypothetical protein [Actinomadura atramentaria]